MKSLFRIAAVVWYAFFALVGVPFDGEAASFARERIVLFDAVAVFDPLGAMEVTETITVQSAQEKIQRGIYRILPIWWDRADNKRFKLDYTVTSVQRDGRDEPFRTTVTNDAVTLRVGSADDILPPGHTPIRSRTRFPTISAGFPSGTNCIGTLPATSGISPSTRSGSGCCTGKASAKRLRPCPCGASMCTRASVTGRATTSA